MKIVMRDNLGVVVYEVDEEYGIDFCDGYVYWTDSEYGADHKTPVEHLLRAITDRTV